MKTGTKFEDFKLSGSLDIALTRSGTDVRTDGRTDVRSWILYPPLRAKRAAGDNKPKSKLFTSIKKLYLNVSINIIKNIYYCHKMHMSQIEAKYIHKTWLWINKMENDHEMVEKNRKISLNLLSRESAIECVLVTKKTNIMKTPDFVIKHQ